MQENKSKYPFVPLRDVVVFPGVTVYLEVARDSLKQAFVKAMEEDRKIITTAQKNPNVENPGMDDLFEVGTLAEVKQIVRMPGQRMQAVITGLERVSLQYLESEEDYLMTTVQPVQEADELLA